MAGLEKIQMTLDYFALIVIAAVTDFAVLAILILYLLEKYNLL